MMTLRSKGNPTVVDILLFKVRRIIVVVGTASAVIIQCKAEISRLNIQVSRLGYIYGPKSCPQDAALKMNAKTLLKHCIVTT